MPVSIASSPRGCDVLPRLPLTPHRTNNKPGGLGCESRLPTEITLPKPLACATLITRAAQVHDDGYGVEVRSAELRNHGADSERRRISYGAAIPFMSGSRPVFRGQFVNPTGWFPGAVTIYDLQRSPIADIRDPCHCLMFHLPRQALDAVTYELSAQRIGDLMYRLGAGIDDPVTRNLLSSLLPATARPSEVPALFLDHVTLALTAHVAHTYGG